MFIYNKEPEYLQMFNNFYLYILINVIDKN